MAKADTVRVVLGSDGAVRVIYNDTLLPLLDALGATSIARASHVEPEGTKWTADMAPVGGPILGPYATRAAALAAEVEWLDSHLSSVSL